jgi:hypothetical protein
LNQESLKSFAPADYGGAATVSVFFETLVLEWLVALQRDYLFIASRAERAIILSDNQRHRLRIEKSSGGNE